MEVYRNLHNGLFSIRCARTKLVLAHGDNFYIDNVTGVVRESGRLKVLRDDQKNVHAWLTGNYKGEINRSMRIGEPVYYNPYKTDRFENIISGSVYFNIGQAFNMNKTIKGEQLI